MPPSIAPCTILEIAFSLYILKNPPICCFVSVAFYENITEKADPEENQTFASEVIR